MQNNEQRAARAVRVEEAALMLGASPATVAIWLRDGRLPGFKLGRSWRIRVSDIEALLEGRAQVPARRP